MECNACNGNRKHHLQYKLSGRTFSSISRASPSRIIIKCGNEFLKSGIILLCSNIWWVRLATNFRELNNCNWGCHEASSVGAGSFSAILLMVR